MEKVKRARAHVARLDLSTAQGAVLDGQAHTARALWNLLHDYFTFRQGRFATLKECDEAIRAARKEIDWMGQLPAQAAQAVLKTYRQAWANYFNPGHPARRPTFKARGRSRPAVDVPQARDLHVKRLNRRWGTVNLPKVGRVRFRWTKNLPGITRGAPAGRVTGARLIKDPFGWSIVFRTEIAVEPARSHQGGRVGIDRGVTVALALSDGASREHGPWVTGTERARLRRLEHKAARQKAARRKGAPRSKRITRTYDQIARLRATAKRRAIDWQHQTTTELAVTFGEIKVEDLRIINMIRSAKGTLESPGKNVAAKTGLNRAINEQAWGRTVTMLEYKLKDRGGRVVKVPAAGTSQTCHQCGRRDPAARISQAVFACTNPACGWVGNADTNAAINIENADGTPVSARGDLGDTRSVKREPPHASAA
ncbi:RNA-guided endonuclease InsQ/TnpB family protein [Nonomuraea sp. NPDC003707]